MIKCKEIYLAVLSVLVLSCGLPKDPRETFQKAHQESFLVGIVTDAKNGDNEVKIELVREFAQKSNVKLDLEYGSETQLISKLETAELHLVTGDFDKETIWEKKVALTIPYDDFGHVFLIPKGENRLLFELDNFIHLK